jgi:acyl carrier protein
MANDDNIDIIALYQEAAQEVAGRKIDGLTLDTKLSDLQLDSVLVLEMTGYVEQKLNVRFDDDELSRLTTLRDLGALVDKARRAA